MKKKFALILGGSSGMGLATVKKLASHGYHILLVHRDRRSAMDAFMQEIAPFADQVSTFNMDGASAEKIQEQFPAFISALGDNKVSVMVHAISRGNLKPIINQEKTGLSDQDILLTIDAMALNVLTWTRLFFHHGLFAPKTSIITLTSAGSERVWKGYAAVGIAKSALENLTRYLAVEMAPFGIRANTLNAGITLTPSLQFIPNYESLMEKATLINPMGRLTTPVDVANAVYLLTLPESEWINGALIHVDGGEHLVS